MQFKKMLVFNMYRTLCVYTVYNIHKFTDIMKVIALRLPNIRTP